MKFPKNIRFRNSNGPKIINRLIKRDKGRNRTKQKSYRNSLINKFNVCPISNIHHKLCEAAHIYPYHKCNSSNDQFSIDNGILLASHIHKAFDKNYFTIDENTCKIKILKII
tara:strand:+ start:169 stop:504 length:336 start_codon:yes stop_codon:yes gene_type:complete